MFQEFGFSGTRVRDPPFKPPGPPPQSTWGVSQSGLTDPVSHRRMSYNIMTCHIISWGHQFHQLHEFHPRHHSVNRLAWGFATDNDQAQAPRHESRSPRSNVCPAIIHEGRTGRQLGFHADDPRRTQGHLDNKLVISVDFPMSGNDTHGFCLCIFNSGRGVGEWREGWG